MVIHNESEKITDMLEFLIGSDIIYGRIMNGSILFQIMIEIIIIISKILIGIKKENIFDSNICSVCNSNKMHSYRAEKELADRNMNIIELL